MELSTLLAMRQKFEKTEIEEQHNTQMSELDDIFENYFKELQQKIDREYAFLTEYYDEKSPSSVQRAARLCEARREAVQHALYDLLEKRISEVVKPPEPNQHPNFKGTYTAWGNTRRVGIYSPLYDKAEIEAKHRALFESIAGSTGYVQPTGSFLEISLYGVPRDDIFIYDIDASTEMFRIYLDLDIRAFQYRKKFPRQLSGSIAEKFLQDIGIEVESCSYTKAAARIK